jgi:hypothetical protein
MPREQGVGGTLEVELADHRVEGEAIVFGHVDVAATEANKNLALIRKLHVKALELHQLALGK